MQVTADIRLSAFELNLRPACCNELSSYFAEEIN